MEEEQHETNAMPSVTHAHADAEPKHSTAPSGRISGLSPQMISRHLPPNSASEVLTGLWVGNLMSVSHITGLGDTMCNQQINKVVVTVISVLGNPNLIRFATDALEQQRIQQAKNNDGGRATLEIHHVIISLKDTVDSDLSSILPDALIAIDEALDKNTKITSESSGNDAKSNTTAKSGPQNIESSASTNIGKRAVRINDNNQQRICLVHCAKGASRSVSVIIAYLLSRHPHRFKTFDEALTHVRTVRPQAMPNIGFALTLRRFEREMNSELK